MTGSEFHLGDMLGDIREHGFGLTNVRNTSGTAKIHNLIQLNKQLKIT